MTGEDCLGWLQWLGWLVDGTDLGLLMTAGETRNWREATAMAPVVGLMMAAPLLAADVDS
jgi:hypothetical protein